jgi:subtilisin family serine protease
MITRGKWALLLLCLCVAACARLQREPDAGYGEAADRQLLVMLRVPAPHFRPDVAYTAKYDSSVGQAARRRIAESLASQYGLSVVDEWPMPALGVDCFVMRAPDEKSLAPLVERLSGDPRVESAQSMNLFKVLSHNDPLYPIQPSASLWHLADIHEITTGKRVRIAQVDTGVEIDHPDLAGQVALTRNFVDGRRDVAEAHGTAVAGIIVARADNGIGIAGIAPAATFLALRACWENPSRGAEATCSSFTLAKALQFALDENAEVINLSVGGPRDRLLERLLDTALSRGVAVVGAADPRLGDGGFPASQRGVLAIAEQGVQDSAAGFLAAPGQDIPTTLPGRRWGIVSGSSFAAAHVTGLVALLLELSPGLQPQQLREALAPQALSSIGTDHSIIVDACAAVARTTGTCACACTVRHAQLQHP